jgi:Sulfatase-modifying factor enzyme 1
MSAGCSRDRSQASDAGPAPSQSALSAPTATPLPQLLFLPDGGDVAQNNRSGADSLLAPQHITGGRCPADMVDIRGAFCIDRYEAALFDARGHRRISPFYHPTRAQTRIDHDKWQKVPALGTDAPAVPEPPAFQLREEPEAMAEAQPGVVPNGYLSAIVARAACERAGKRLCTLAEWVTACRGQANRKFPYGDEYRDGACNVYREAHPASILHGDASKHHLDPRLNLTRSERGPLLRQTGATSTCRSEWGQDAAFDMVGNLDEWVDVEGGAFVGGFYSRATREGCDSKITSHPPEYFDYSLGVRCCQ